MSQSAIVNVPNIPSGLPVDNTLVLRDGQLAYRQRVETYPGDVVSLDASARLRVSQLTTLFDGKTLNADDPNLWDQKGTGTPSFANSSAGMAVTAGQYLVRHGKYFAPYFSGKSQLVEVTFDTFANQADVTKRVGYYTCNTVAPFNAGFDGFWLESAGGTYKLCMAKDGVKTLDLDWTQWDGYAALQDYDWNAFTVVLFDFLWLGGAVLRMFVKSPAGGFVLAHEFNYAGTAPGVFMRSPNKPVRYEIRSSGGAGSFRAVCSQVSSEGSLSEQVQSRTLINPTAVPCNNIGTVYALKGVRALAAFRDQAVRLVKFGGAVISAQTDGGVLLLYLNPTLSAPLSWATNGTVEDGTGNGTQIVTPGTGQLLDALFVVNSAESSDLATSTLAQLQVGLDNAMGELVLAFAPYTATQSVTGKMTVVRN